MEGDSIGKIMVLKETASIDPSTKKRVKAGVVQEGDGVYLLKTYASGRRAKALLERDASLYKTLTDGVRPKSQLPFNSLVLNVTLRCNLRCPMCYTSSPIFGRDLPIEDIRDLSNMHKKKTIVICGGEPTVRNDLPEIIEAINDRNVPLLSTNGIRLADYDYLLKLKKSGLKYILFSFNGFDDEIYKKINGRPLLKTKLLALENAKKAGMKIILSLTLVRGVNDDKRNLKKIFNYFIKNRTFVKELKLRTMSPVGRRLDGKCYTMGELLDITTESFGIKKSDVLNEIAFMKEMDGSFKRHSIMPCKIDFFFRVKDGKILPIVQKRNLEEIGKARFKKAALSYQTIKGFGVRTLVKQWLLENKIIGYKDMFVYGPDIFKISLRVWPNKFNIDLEENHGCRTGVYVNGTFLPFCYANAISCG